MSSVFNAYARYYDLLYCDKDYAGEAAYVDRLIQRHRSGTRSLLELGSGTGKHARLLAEKGYEVHGVERSADMLAIAQAAPFGAPSSGLRPPTFSQGDLRDVRVGKPFEAVISLFHVISYMPANADLLKAFATARAHLVPGGLFVFDFWYGPAVLSERPAVRVKRMEDDRLAVTRLAEPVLNTEACQVEVNYHLFLRDKAADRVEEIRETHLMRYLFLPEVEHLLASSGLGLRHAEEWMTGQTASPSTWGVCVVAEAMEAR